MGNWRTVHIHGRVDEKDVDKLRGVLYCAKETEDSWDYLPLAWHENHSICGINDWVGNGTINVVGNLNEKDVTNEEVVAHCFTIANMFPSASFKIDMGGNYENLDCVATVIVENGTARIVAAEVEKIPDISADAIRGRLMTALFGL